MISAAAATAPICVASMRAKMSCSGALSSSRPARTAAKTPVQAAHERVAERHRQGVEEHAGEPDADHRRTGDPLHRGARQHVGEAVVVDPVGGDVVRQAVGAQALEEGEDGLDVDERGSSSSA